MKMYRINSTVLTSGMRILLIFFLFFIVKNSQGEQTRPAPSLGMNQVKMQIQEVKRFRSAGLLPDGTLIARVVLSYDKPHSGFQVWSQRLNRSLLNADRELLLGRTNSKNRIRVRMQGDKYSWQPDLMGRGVIIKTTENQVVLNIVLEGQQVVPADVYPISLHAIALALEPR